MRAHGRAARRAGYEPHVVCVCDAAAERETGFGAVHAVHGRLRWRRLFDERKHQRIWDQRSAARAAVALARRTGARVLHGFGLYGHAAVAAAAALRRAGQPTAAVVSAYDSLLREVEAKRRGWRPEHGLAQRLSLAVELAWARAVVPPLERRTYQRAERVLVNYESVRRILAERYGARRDVVRLRYASERAFVDEPAESPPPPGLPAGRAPLLVAVSRHDPRKGLDVLLRALVRLRAAGVPFRACLVGRGPLLAAHRRIAERAGLGDAVALTGYVPDPWPFLRAADVFALPSLAEGSGSLSLLEALQAGAAVVASRVDGLGEDLRHGEDGLLVPPGDDAALARALARLLADAPLRAALARRGRATFESRFGAGSFAEALRQVYEELTAAL